MKILTDELFDAANGAATTSNRPAIQTDPAAGGLPHYMVEAAAMFDRQYDWWLKNTIRGRRQAVEDASYSFDNVTHGEVVARRAHNLLNNSHEKAQR